MARLFPDSNFVAPAIVEGHRLVIGDAPRELEAQMGEPLIGPNGAWLRGRKDLATGLYHGGLFKRAGIDDSKVSRMNCLQCRPPNDDFPTDPDARAWISKEDANAAVAHCYNSHVLPVLRGRDWSRIDLLGPKPLQIVAKVTDGGTMRWRGSPLPIPDIDLQKPITVPTLHPSDLAREQSYLPVVVSDLKKSLQESPEFYNTRPTLEEVQAFTATRFCFDIETRMDTGEVTMVGLCDRPYYAMSVPFAGSYKKELVRIFKNAEEVITQNGVSFDVPILFPQLGITYDPTRVKNFDTMLAHHLCQPDLPHGLAFIGSLYSNKKAWKHLAGNDEELYNCRDTDVTFQAARILKPLLAAEGLTDLYENLSVPVGMICRQMHELGFRIDPSRIGAVRDELTKESQIAEANLPEHLRSHTMPVRKRVLAPLGTLSEKTGKPVKYLMVASVVPVTPWRSTVDVQKFLYEDLKLPVQLHIKSQRPTSDKTALDRLARAERRSALRTQGDVAERHATSARYLEAIQKLRKLDELLTTFCKEEMLTKDRQFSHFNVHGTATGRLSSSDPNLQNIPPAARYIYVPSHDDWRLLEFDFSSIENRLMAYFVNDTERITRWAVDPSFNEHKRAAEIFFGVPYDEVDKESSLYKTAKVINHGCDGGLGPKKIALMHDMDLSEVRKLTALWREINHLTVKGQEEIAKEAKANGVLTNPFGRKRWFYTDSVYTESIRTPPQSTGADIIFRAMIGLMYDRIGWPEERARKVSPILDPLPLPARLLITVHDSLIFEAPGIMVDEIVPRIIRVMTQPWKELGGMSIPVEVKVGDPGASWAECRKYQPELVLAA